MIDTIWWNCFVWKLFCCFLQRNIVQPCKQSFYIPTKALNRTRNQKFTFFPLSFERRPSIHHQPTTCISSTEVSYQGWGFLWLWRSSRCKSSSRRWGLATKFETFCWRISVKWWYFSKMFLGWIGWDMGSMTFWDVFIPLMSKMFLGVFPWNLGSMGFFSLSKLEKMISQFDLRRIFNFWLRRCVEPLSPN